MELRNLVLMILVLTLFSGLTSAAEFGQDSYTTTYGTDSLSVTVNLPPEKDNSNTPYYLSAQGCKGSLDSFPDSSGTLSFDMVHVPGEIRCGYGTHTLEVVNGYTNELVASTDLHVTANGMDEHKGKYLYLQMDLNDDEGAGNQLHRFFLSNEKWNADPAISQGQIGIQEWDDDYGAFTVGSAQSTASYKTEQGIISPTDSGGMNQIGTGTNEVNVGSHDSIRYSYLFSYPFEQSTKSIGIPGSQWGLSTFSPLHSKGLYNPSGEIALGYEPDIKGNPGLNGQGRFFFVCRSGNLGFSRTGKVVSVNGQLYKCDTTGSVDYKWKENVDSGLGYGNWVPVTECNDDLNNNGAFGADTNDPACNQNPGTEEEGNSECQAVVGYPESNDLNGKHAFYDSSENGVYSPESSSCQYSSISGVVDYTNQEPVVFECYDNSDLASIDAEARNYDGPTPDAADNYCQNRLGTADSYAQNPMPAVQYFVPKAAMQLGSTWARDVNNGFRPNYRFQLLHEAESKYRGSEPHHESTTWSEHNMLNLDGYTNNNPSNYLDAWDVSNASGINNNEVDFPKENRREATVDDENVFDGGFHGECSSAMNWTYSGGEWQCDVGSAGLQTMEINSYMLDGDLGGKLAGFQINWSEMQKWQGAHPAVPPEGKYGADAVEVRAMCWWGGQKERPQDLQNDVVNLSATVSEGKTTYVVGKLPERNPAPSKTGSYSCVFGLHQWVDILQITPSTETTLFWKGEEGTHEDATNRQYGVITEGTNDAGKGNVRIVSEQIRPASNMQQWLDGKQANDNPGKLWTHFPRYPDVPEDNRNPWQACLNNGECGVAGNN